MTNHRQTDPLGTGHAEPKAVPTQSSRQPCVEPGVL